MSHRAPILGLLLVLPMATILVDAQNCDVGGTPPTAQIMSSPLSIYSCNGQIDVWRNGVDQVYFSDAGPLVYVDGTIIGFTGTAGPSAGTLWSFNGSGQLSPTSYEDRITAGNVSLTQTISYAPGSDYFTIQLSATNNGAAPIADFRVLYGADAFVNGDDQSDYGQEDWAMTRTVGVRDDTPSPLFTGFSGINHMSDPSVAVMSYYTEGWSQNWAQVLTGALPSTINPVPADQGISIAFHKAGGLAIGETWRITTETVFDFPAVALGVSCFITSPSAGATVDGDVDLIFDGNSFSSSPITSRFEFSTDGGVTFAPMTAAAGSPLSNPDPGRPSPFTGANFRWNSVADGAGLTGPQAVLLQVAVDDGSANSVCQVSVTVDNQPACNITSPIPGATVAGDVSVTFDGSSPGGQPLTSTFEFSTNGGVTWQSATAAPSSPTSNPDSARPSPFSGVVFIWDAVADGVGTGGAQIVEFRIMVQTSGGAGECSVNMLMIDNAPRCSITAPVGGSTHSGDVTISFGGSDPGNDPLTSTFEYSVDGGATWNLATAAGSSPTANPDPARPTPFAGVDFHWDTVADGLAGQANVMVRITVDDGAGTSTCGLTLNIDNEPVCSITSPAPGAALAGNVSISFNTASPSGNQLTAAFAASTDGGTTFFAASDAGTGSLMGNPTAAFPAGSSDWTWATADDIPGAATGVIIEVTVCDVGLAACTACRVTVDIDNTPSCAINSPGPGPVISGPVPVNFNGLSPGSLSLTSTFDFSVDGGVTFTTATAAPASAVMNPDPARPAPFGGVVFTWDAAADGAGSAGVETVTFRIRVDNGGAVGSCETTFDVDNGQICSLCGDCNQSGTGPDIIDSLTAAQIAVSLIVPTAVQTACCDVDIDGDVDVIDLLILAQVAAGLPVALMCL